MIQSSTLVDTDLYPFLLILVTKDKEKLQNINDAMAAFENWLKEFEASHKSKENRTYLPLVSIQALLPLKQEYAIDDKKSEAFLAAYKASKGEYKFLRTVSSGEGEPTWDIVRNNELRVLLKDINDNDSDLWNDDVPSKEHMKLILWAYSPDASKIKKNLQKYEEKFGKMKLEDKDEEEGDNENEKNEEKDSDEGEQKRVHKRKSESESNSSNSGSEEESPKKKSRTE